MQHGTGAELCRLVLVQDVERGADLLEPHRPSRLRGEGPGELREVLAVAEALRGHPAVSLGGAVEDPRVDRRDVAEARGVRRFEGMVIEIPDGVVLRVQSQTSVAGRHCAEERLDPGSGLCGRGPHRRRVRISGELVHLVAEGQGDVGGQVLQRAVDLAGELDLRVDHLGVGEHVPCVPGRQPCRQEVVAGHVSLDYVHGDVQTRRGGDLSHPTDVREGLLAHQSAVGLEDRPEREDAHVVQAQTGEGLEVAAHLVPVRTEPGVEPAVARYVVDAEAQGRGRGAHPLIPPCSSPRMKYRCIATKRAMIGISAMMVPAAISRGSS